MFFSTIINLSLLAFGPTGYGDELFWGLLLTIQISVLAYALGLILGLCGAIGKLTGGKWLRGLLDGYTTLVRAIPDLVLILLLYYAGTDGLNRTLASIIGEGFDQTPHRRETGARPARSSGRLVSE